MIIDNKRTCSNCRFSSVCNYAYLDGVCEMWQKEIVHCRDCANRGTDDCAMSYECSCGEQHMWNTDNDFCSWGEE